MKIRLKSEPVEDLNIVLKPMFYSWVGLVSKNYEIERACMELEREAQDLENQRKKINWKRKHEQLEDESKTSHPEDGQVLVFVVLTCFVIYIVPLYDL